MSSTHRPMGRRDLLKAMGAVATGTLLPTAGCVDDGAVAADDSGLGGVGDAGATDAGAHLGDAGAGSGDVSPGPAPALSPLRRDGSHPFDYIDHVVIVQMENRSFDHYFGSLSLLEGRTDIDGLLAGMSNPARDGRVIAPRHLTSEYLIDPDPGHGHGDSMDQFNLGRNDGFVRNYEPKLDASTADRLDWPMGYYVRDQLPAFYTLADHFTLCERWFCSLLGPTWPNRYFSHAATSDGLWSNGTPLAARTIYANAMQAGLSVGCYRQHPVHFMMVVQDPAPGSYPSEPVETFFEHAAQGRLPNISVVEPNYGFNDDHPPHDVRLGQAFVAGVYEALRQSPQWDRTLMLVFYDEHGGFHDHVAPPTAAGETRVAEGFDQLGFRVPGMVIGPLARRGHVMRDVVDHASVPSLIANIFGLDHVNDRARLAGDLGAALDIELTLDANRVAPVALPEIAIPDQKIRHAAGLPFGQPELAEYALRRFGIGVGGFDDNMRRAERWLTALERYRVARVY